MSFPLTATKIAFAGDWHGQYTYMRRACYWAHKKGAEVIVQVGDFGFWKDSAAYDILNAQLEEWGMYLLFIDGNHENFPLLYNTPLNNDGVRPIRDRIIHLPRGFRWSWYIYTFTALGGAHSIDKDYRFDGVDWFKEEDITVDDMKKTVDGGPTDFLITHDSPYSANTPLDPAFAAQFSDQQVHECDLSRWMLEKVCQGITPTWIVHGHYHVDYEAETKWNNGGTCKITGLNCDGSAFDRNMIIVDLTELDLT